MSKIYGRPEVIDYAKKAKAGQTNVVVNFDLIEELSNQYEVKLVEVPFDPAKIEKFFTDMDKSKKSPKWYPTINFMYNIANARGVMGSDASFEILYEDVEIDEMDMTNTERIVHKKVGYVVKKSASVLNEDGSLSNSGERISMENAWEECVKVWHKEEAATQGYSPDIIKEGEYTYYNKKYYGKYYMVKSGKWENATPLKYDTKWKRKACFDEALDKALGKADSKAKSKAIREIVGLPTCFAPEDLESGKIIVSRVIRSRNAIALEAAADLQARAKGMHDKTPEKLLFGEPAETVQPAEPETIPNAYVKPEPKQQDGVIDFSDFAEEEIKPKDNRTALLVAYTFYNTERLTPEPLMEASESVKQWLGAHEDAETNPELAKFWEASISRIKKIEEGVPAEKRLKKTFWS